MPDKLDGRDVLLPLDDVDDGVGAWFGFLFAARRNGFFETLVKAFFLMPALLVFIWITWSICGKGSSDTGSMLTLLGSIGASATVVALLLKRPRTPRDPS